MTLFILRPPRGWRQRHCHSHCCDLKARGAGDGLGERRAEMLQQTAWVVEARELAAVDGDDVVSGHRVELDLVAFWRGTGA